MQNLRKDSGFEVIDRIKIMYNSDDTIQNSINAKREYIISETLAESIEFQAENNDFETFELNDTSIKLKISKIA